MSKILHFGDRSTCLLTVTFCTSFIILSLSILLIFKVKWAYSSSQADLPSPLRELTFRMGSHNILLPAIRQRWHSRLYSSRSWYSI